MSETVVSDKTTTAPTYLIRTVADFLLVPEDRLGECLREFRIMLDMARATLNLTSVVADEMARSGAIDCEPGAIRFTLADKFEWIDDGLRTATLNIRVPTDEETADV